MLKCGYCGRENPDEAQACSGCGTLFPESPPQGPTATPAPASAGALHILNGVSELQEDNADSPQAMLERAAVLESVNMQAAVLLYQQILLKHPKSSAAREARRNIQTLRVAHPELRL